MYKRYVVMDVEDNHPISVYETDSYWTRKHAMFYKSCGNPVYLEEVDSCFDDLCTGYMTQL